MTRKLSLGFILWLIALTVVIAQEGTIRGTVTDKASGEPLMFTNVVVNDTDPIIGAQTDLDGNYEIRIAPGTYSLSVTYVGYTQNTITDVVVEEKEVTITDFLMEEESQELEEVIVKAERIDRTENALIALQRKAFTIQDGISAQEISRFGSNNAAESMKRVTGASVVDGKYVFVRGLGDRYTSAQLNGQNLPSTDPYRNSMQLDLIPSNLLDNVIASKTFTPDQPGNFTGGNVNLKTKSFPERFTLAASIGASYNTQSSFNDNFLTHNGGNLDWLGYDDGTRAIPDVLQDLNLVTSSYIRCRKDPECAQRIDLAANSLNQQRTPNTTQSLFNHNASFSLGNQFIVGNNPLGVLFGINYRKSYSFYENGDFQYWELTDPNAENLNPNRELTDSRGVETPQIGGMLNLSYKIGNANKLSFIALYNHIANKDTRYLSGPFPAIISGNGQFETRALRFRERAFQDYQLSGEHVLGQNGIKIEWGGSFVKVGQDDPDFRQFSNTFKVDNNGDKTYQITPAEFDLPFHFFRNLEDVQYNAKFDVTIPFAQGKSKANKIQFGGTYSDKDRVFTDNVFQIQTTVPTAAKYQGDPEKFFGPDNIGIIDFNEDTERYTYGLYPINFEKATKENSYTGYERIAAAYGMAVYDMGKFKVIGGTRLETTDIFVESRDTSLATGSINQVDFLPSLNLIYRLNDDMNLRASATQTLARPNMRELAPFTSFDFGGDFRIKGNPDLERTLIQNYDFRWEWYTNPGELIAVSTYYKNFINPIVTAFVLESANPLIEYTNVDRAQVYGIEFEFRKKLDFLSPSLKDFKFATNVSLINSVVDIPEDEVAVINLNNPEKGNTRPFQGQSPYLVNASLNYNNVDMGLDAIVSINVFGRRLSDISEGANPDVYEDPRPQLDFSVSKGLTQRWGLRINANNLLNPNVQRSMRYKGNDYLIQRFRTGRTIGMSLSYKI